MTRTRTVSLLVVAALAALLAVLSRPADGPSPYLAVGSTASASAGTPGAPPAAAPTVRLLHNDPLHDPHTISDALVADIDGAPAGSLISVRTYWISSDRVADALARAFRRGVVVQVIVAGGATAGRTQSVALERLLGADTTDDSWLMRSRTAARGPRGIMHEKTYRFSQTGGLRWVTVTGSWNTADSADLHTYAAMWRVTDRKDVYDAFASVAAEQARQVSAHPALREFRGAGWSAYFLPATAKTRGGDPVARRLAAIPARPGTVVRIAMYSMWGERAAWLSRRLVALRRGGADVEVIAGPTVSRATLHRLRAGRITVHSGCFRDGSFAHGKDMTASWLANGRRVAWTWVGSDNWTTRGMESDQAVLGISGMQGYRDLSAALASMAERPDGVFGRACHPARD